jgi:hypothetical protein
MDAIRIIENITDKDDPAWEWAVEDFYDEESDTFPTLYEVLQTLGVTEAEYKSATNAQNTNWPEVSDELYISQQVRIDSLEAELSTIKAQREWVNKSEAAAFECQYEETSYHPKLHLLAKERTGWRRWVFGRWVYKSEPFRRDIQRRCARAGLHTLHEEPWERWHDPDDV